MISTEITASNFVEIDKLKLKFIQRWKRLGIVKTLLKENKDGKIIFPDFKIFYKITITQFCSRDY